MDGGITEMINGVLSNPDALSKIMTLMPAVAQMMNGGGSNNLNNINSLNAPNQEKQEKIVETTAVNKSGAANGGISAENLMANEKVMSAFKNLLAALNEANETNETPPNDGDGVPASSFQNANNTNNNNNNNNNINADNIANIASMLGSAMKSQGNGGSPADGINHSQTENSGIEKTLDTLKNFTSATNPENDHKSKLLLALKPFLKDGRKTKIDTAIKYMNAAKIINLFGKNGFV